MNSVYNDNDFQSKNSDEFLEKYAFVVMNSDEFYSMFSNSSRIWLTASSFLLTNYSNITLKQYAEAQGKICSL